MKIQYASDLHLEFPANSAWLKKHPLQPVGELLVLAGDIVPFAVQEKHRDFFSYVADHFHTTYWLPGNHEYYQFDMAQHSEVLHEAIRSNVFLVNNTSVVHNQVKLIFSTLWSHISPANQWQIERNLSDFRAIKQHGRPFNAEMYNQRHAACLAFLQQAVKTSQGEKAAVFTHHCPTFLNYPEQYKGDALNEAFAVELYDFIAESGLSCWGYGHHHTNTPVFQIGNTQLITNQLGYVQLNEHGLFQRDRVIELGG